VIKPPVEAELPYSADSWSLLELFWRQDNKRLAGDPRKDWRLGRQVTMIERLNSRTKTISAFNNVLDKFLCTPYLIWEDKDKVGGIHMALLDSIKATSPRNLIVEAAIVIPPRRNTSIAL
jgi:hypothetical protein